MISYAIRSHISCKTSVTGMCRWDKADLNFYCNRTRYLLHRSAPPVMFKCVHWSRVNSYHNAIVNSLHVAMSDYVSVLHKGSLKLLWSSKLHALKEASVEAYKMSNLCGRPGDGLTNKVRLECNYKLAMNEEALFHNMDCDDKLSILYLMIINFGLPGIV